MLKGLSTVGVFTREKIGNQPKGPQTGEGLSEAGEERRPTAPPCTQGPHRALE